MGLDIWSEDDEKFFHISYFGFSDLKKSFLLSYNYDVYVLYVLFIEAYMKDNERLVELLDEMLQLYIPNDLLILINHSDIDGELNSFECKRLLPYLNINPRLIKEYISDNEFLIKKMNEFKEIVEYGDTEDVKLIFG